MAVSFLSATLDRWLESLERRRTRSSSRRTRVELGDFGRHTSSLRLDDVSVYDALVRSFLGTRPGALAGQGLVLGIDAEPRWMDVLPAGANVEVVRATGHSVKDVSAAENADWLVLDRCLQRLPDMPRALEAVVGRLKPNAALITLFTGIARAEPVERRPLWSVAPYAARRLHEERPELERVEVEQYGNVTLALAWIYRLPTHALTAEELAAIDPAYPLLVAVTASKRAGRR
jgi:hypothetical protein